MKRLLLVLGVLAAASTALAGCGSPSTAAHRASPTPRPAAAVSPSPAPPPTPSANPSATPAPGTTTSPAPGYSTAQQAADAGARQSGQTICPDQYPGTPSVTADQASVYQYNTGGCGAGGHAAMVVYVYRDAGGWHPYTWGETQNGGLPTGTWGQFASVPSGGCVNVHQGPSVSAPVVTCVDASAILVPAGSDHSPWYPPVWADQKLWWYVFRPTSAPYTQPVTGTPLGWIALDYLVCDTIHDPGLSC